MPDTPRTDPETADFTGTFTKDTAQESRPKHAFAGSAGFTFVRSHAEGGLGRVSVAKDNRLRREVALKEIRPEVDHPRTRQRFLNEAEITGRLEHPGVVPVYALDVDSAGRPFYAMRFVQGRTLGDAIRLYHEHPTPLGFADLLRRLASVCQTIAYAHSKGILHRDLKPANIMLGDYGETLVLDWGLAKDISKPDADGAHPAHDAAAENNTATPLDDAALTRAGQALGTPAYMSPEQAKGQEVGPATDIFALGAILFEILTGRPPYQGPDVLAVLALAQRGEAPNPGSVRRGIPSALDAVCHKALARDPETRYTSAAELGTDVDRWLADEPVAAQREPLMQRARRLVKRHRVKFSVLLAALLAALPLAIALYINADRALTRITAAEKGARRSLGIATAHNSFLNEDLLDSPVIRVRGREATLFEIVEAAAPAIDKRFADLPECKAHIQLSVGSIYNRLGEHERAIPYLQAALAYHEQDSPRDESACRHARAHLSSAIMPQGRLEEAEALLRQNLNAEVPELGEAGGYADTLISLGEVLTLQERLDEADKYLKEALQICERRLGMEHRLTLCCMVALSKVRYLQGEIRESELLDRKVLAGRLKLYPADHFEVLEARNNLAVTIVHLGRHDEAAAVFRDVLETCRRVKGPNHADTLMTLGSLALAVSKSENPAAAEPLHQEALSRLREHHPDDHPGIAVELAHYGHLLMNLKRHPEAEPHLREALKLRRECLPAGHRLIGESESRLGACLSTLLRYAEAESLLRAGHETLAAAVHASPGSRVTAIKYLVSHYEAVGNTAEAARWRAKLPATPKE